MPGPVVSHRRAFMGMPRAAHVRLLPRCKPAEVGVLDAPRRGQDPSLRGTRKRQAVGSGLDCSGQACARAAFPGENPFPTAKTNVPAIF